MDIATIVYVWDAFKANHQRTCGAERLDVSMNRDGEPAPMFKLVCPTCGASVSGTIRDGAMPQLIALLGSRGQ